MSAFSETKLDTREQKLERWAREWYERAINQRDLTFLKDVVSEDFACSNTTLWSAQGLAGTRAAYERYLTAFPDAKARVDDIFVKANEATGDMINVWWTLTGTNSGPLVLEGDRGTIEPTGRKVTITTSSFLIVHDWKLIGSRVISDLMTQLGVQPPPVKN